MKKTYEDYLEEAAHFVAKLKLPEYAVQSQNITGGNSPESMVLSREEWTKYSLAGVYDAQE